MTWTLVARKEFADAVRSQSLWALSSLFVLAVPGLSIGYVVVSARPVVATLLVYLGTLAKWLVPVVALAVGYPAIVGEREAGTLTFLLGLPHTRGDIVLGKFVGSTAAVWAAVSLGFLVNVPVVLLLYADLPFGRYLTLAGLTLLLGAAFVGISVSISAATRSPVRAAAASIGAFVCFLFLWDLVPAGAYYVVYGGLPGNAIPPDWFFFLRRLNPANAFTTALVSTFPNLASPVSTPRPFYLSPTASVTLLVTWILVPLGVGYVRLRRMDIA